jgi:hypothetical protein
MSQEWNQLTPEQKQPHLLETESQKQRYESEMKIYKQKKADEDTHMKSAAPKAEPKLAGKKRPAATTVASVVKEVKAPAAPIQPTIASALAKT